MPTEARNLIVRQHRTAVFYLLPKIHKVGVPGRPIVSAYNCPTEHIARYLDSILQPIVASQPTYVKDTNHALEVFDGFRFQQGKPRFLFSMDVKSLYTSIPHNEGLLALEHYLNLRSRLDPPTHVLLRLAELLLTSNCFTFNNRYFLQKRGVAMGSCLGPSYACLFMSYQEHLIFESYQGVFPDLYRRYIDDGVGAASLERDELLQFINYICNFNPAIQYTYEISELTINFLDILLRTDGDSIVTSIYTKPTDSHSYLQYGSSHPSRCKDSIPFSQLLRLRRICSVDSDFREKAAEFCSYFNQRGYPNSVTSSALEKVSSLSRDVCLNNYRVNHHSNERPILTLTYHPLSIRVKNVIYKHLNILRSNQATSSTFTDIPLTAWRRDTNLNNILVHTEQRGIDNTHGSFPCDRTRCNTCPFITNTNHVFGPKNSMAVTDIFTCTTTNVVYCITCLKCGLLYVGSTIRRLGDRFAEHLRLTRQNNHCYPVSVHFNTNDHSVSDMSISGIYRVSGNEDLLRLKEEEIIFRLGTFEPNGINKQFTSFPINIV